MATPTDRDLITRCALDYFEGWFDGDPERMDSALHAELVKRDGDDELDAMTKADMVEATRRGQGRRDDGRDVEVEVVDIHGPIASAVVRSVPYREYLHLVRTQDGWKIANTLYARS